MVVSCSYFRTINIGGGGKSVFGGVAVGDGWGNCVPFWVECGAL